MNSLRFFAVAHSVSVFLIFPRCSYVGANGWITGIASHGSVFLSWGWLVTVEAFGHPGLPPSTQLDACVDQNDIAFLLHLYPLLSFTFI